MKRALVSFFFGVVALAAADAPTSWTPEFSLQFQTIGPVVPSHDGSWVAWTQTRAVIDTEKSDEITQIFIAKADGSQRRQLTRGEKSSTLPAWSPDGKWIYFTSPRYGKNDLFRIQPDGGEAEQLTRLKGGVGVFALSKDGHFVAYSNAEPDPDIEKAIKEKRDFHIVDEKPRNAILYVMPTEGGLAKPRALTTPDRHIQELTWSPEGGRVAFVAWATPVVNDWRKAKTGEVEIATGAIKELAVSGTFGSRPAYSPDGRYLAFPQSSSPVSYPGASRIALYDRKSGSVRQLSATPDELPRMIAWKPDSTGILITEGKRTGSAIFEVPVDAPVKEVFAPAAGVLGQGHLDDAGRVMGLSSEATDKAPEAYVLKGQSMIQVSAANTELPKLPLGKTEPFQWTSKDGAAIEGLLTYPVGYQPGTKAPLILNIHGGPAGAFSQQFIGRAGLYPIAVFAAKGYAVLRPNPHGSSGYGKAFRESNYKDWGGTDYLDDQSGVDALIAKGIADPNRMAVMGWSYGGYMTSWTIGHTTRFKAAAVGAGVTNLVSFTGTTDIADFLPDYFSGEFWQQPDLYRERSPITYAGKITTPTLVLHGEADERVPMTQGVEFYHAVKRNGTPAKMVTYPRQPHGPHEPKFVLDIMQRHLDWVDQYVK